MQRSLPALTASQMREVDRLMVEEVRIELLQMMENAGRALAEQARRHLDGLRGKRVLVLAGSGGNGGGGMAAARRLSIVGADVRVLLAREPELLQGVPRRQLDVLVAMRVRVRALPLLRRSRHRC